MALTNQKVRFMYEIRRTRLCNTETRAGIDPIMNLIPQNPVPW